jgi:hypothetical protein
MTELSLKIVVAVTVWAIAIAVFWVHKKWFEGDVVQHESI